MIGPCDRTSRSDCCLGSVVLTSTILGFEHIKDLYPNDPDFSYIYNHCLEAAFNKFYLVQGFLFRMNRLCIPQGSIREFLVHESHLGGLMGHFGVTKTLDMVMEHFSFGHICAKQWKRCVLLASRVKKLNLRNYMMVCLWTSFLAYLVPREVEIVFLSLYTGFPRWHILFLVTRRMMQHM
ncbi:hypothetical protein GQ457_02G026920 [Hibiscus cannabinus]